MFILSNKSTLILSLKSFINLIDKSIEQPPGELKDSLTPSIINLLYLTSYETSSSLLWACQLTKKDSVRLLISVISLSEKSLLDW